MVSIFGVVIFGVILLIATLITDLVVGKFWRRHPSLRLIVQTIVLGCGLWWVAATAMAQNAGQAEAQWLEGLIVTAPSVVLSSIVLLLIGNARKRKLQNPADDF
ncbi:MAG TPA: hypothetical protein PK417_13085 [Hyphomonas sp.]|nr:hypothetical protein [Hyphomonas sp.]